jgi:hypothetical protein
MYIFQSNVYYIFSYLYLIKPAIFLANGFSHAYIFISLIQFNSSVILCTYIIKLEEKDERTKIKGSNNDMLDL